MAPVYSTQPPDDWTTYTPSLCRRVKGDRQALEAEEETSLEQLGRLIVYDPQIGQLLDNHRQRDRGLHARKGRTDAEMDAVSKRDMPVRRARDVETLRLRELPGVTVGRGQPGEDQLVLGNGHAG